MKNTIAIEIAITIAIVGINCIFHINGSVKL
jgi:hypothetical protein